MRAARFWFWIVRAIGAVQRVLYRLEAVGQRRGAAALCRRGAKRQLLAPGGQEPEGCGGERSGPVCGMSVLAGILCFAAGEARVAAALDARRALAGSGGLVHASLAPVASSRVTL